jgi:antitoxin VapB
VSAQRRVKLFRNCRNQPVRIPREFELSDEEAILRKDGNRLIIEPAPPRSLLALLATLQPIDEEFPPIPELPNDSAEMRYLLDTNVVSDLVRRPQGAVAERIRQG